MSIHNKRERRSQRRHAALIELYVSGWGARRFQAANHSAEGLFVVFGRDWRAKLTEGEVLELVFVLRSGNIARLQRRQAVIAHLDAQGAGLRLYHS